MSAAPSKPLCAKSPKICTRQWLLPTSRQTDILFCKSTISKAVTRLDAGDIYLSNFDAKMSNQPGSDQCANFLQLKKKFLKLKVNYQVLSMPVLETLWFMLNTNMIQLIVTIFQFWSKRWMSFVTRWRVWSGFVVVRTYFKLTQFWSTQNSDKTWSSKLQILVGWPLEIFAGNLIQVWTLISGHWLRYFFRRLKNHSLSLSLLHAISILGFRCMY